MNTELNTAGRGLTKRPKLRGDAPLTPWELEKVARDAEVAARYLRSQPRNAQVGV